MGYFVATVPSGMLQSARLKEWLAPVSKEPVFESILEHDGAGFAYFIRHASSPDLRLLLLVFGSLAVFSVVIAAGFAMAGAWLIIPFAGVEIAALGMAARLILRHAGDFERINRGI